MQYWRNPYLIVLRDGVELRVGESHSRKTVNIEELPRLLAELPVSAWPYGRIIGGNDNGLGSGNDFRYIDENHKRVDALLKCLRLQVTWVPPA